MDGVSIQEAAQVLGVAQDTVRRRIRRGELQAHQEPMPQGFRWVVALAEESQAGPTPLNGHGIDDGQIGEAQGLRELVDTLQAQVKAQVEELEARCREVQELHVLLQQDHDPAGDLTRPWNRQPALPALEAGELRRLLLPAGEGRPWWRRLWPEW